MSCCLIIQKEKELFFAVDTAESDVSIKRHNKPEITRIKGSKVKKIYKYGKDLCFISGVTDVTLKVKDKIKNFVVGDHINIDLLSDYLRENYPPNKEIMDMGFNVVGVTVLQIINDKSICVDIRADKTDFNYKVVTYDCKPNDIKCHCMGYKTKEVGSIALNMLRNMSYVELFSSSYEHIFVESFQKSYCEGVGGSLILYHMDEIGNSILKTIDLVEKDIKYADDSCLKFRSCIDAADGKFTGTVSAGTIVGCNINGNNISGGTIEGTLIEGSEIYGNNITGGTITGTNINGVTITGGTINGATLRGNDVYIKDSLYIYDSTEDINGNTGGDFEALKIVGDAFASGNTSYHLYLGNENMEDVTIPTQLIVSGINGGTPLTSRSTPDKLEWDNSDIWTASGNFRTGGTHNLASVDYVQDNFARQSTTESLASRISALESAITSQN